jgi:hypothetical protein
MPCLHAISSLLEKDRKRRIGAIGWDTFTDNPFFRPIDFIALESKEIMPVLWLTSDLWQWWCQILTTLQAAQEPATKAIVTMLQPQSPLNKIHGVAP